MLSRIVRFCMQARQALLRISGGCQQHSKGNEMQQSWNFKAQAYCSYAVAVNVLEQWALSGIRSLVTAAKAGAFSLHKANGTQSLTLDLHTKSPSTKCLHSLLLFLPPFDPPFITLFDPKCLFFTLLFLPLIQNVFSSHFYSSLWSKMCFLHTFIPPFDPKYLHCPIYPSLPLILLVLPIQACLLPFSSNRVCQAWIAFTLSCHNILVVLNPSDLLWLQRLKYCGTSNRTRYPCVSQQPIFLNMSATTAALPTYSTPCLQSHQLTCTHNCSHHHLPPNLQRLPPHPHKLLHPPTLQPQSYLHPWRLRHVGALAAHAHVPLVQAHVLQDGLEYAALTCFKTRTEYVATWAEQHTWLCCQMGGAAEKNLLPDGQKINQEPI